MLGSCASVVREGRTRGVNVIFEDHLVDGTFVCWVARFKAGPLERMPWPPWWVPDLVDSESDSSE